MPSPELSPGLSPVSPPVEVATPVEAVTKERKGKERFATVPTEIPEVSLRIEPGAELDILKRTVGEFFQATRVFALNKFQIDRIEVQQKTLGEEIRTTAQTHDGLRGAQSERDNFKLNVIPKVRVEWNLDLVKESTGPAYSSVVHEDVVVTISVPVGFQTKKGPADSEKLQQAVRKALVGLGFGEDDLPKFVDVTVEGRVDEKRLKEMQDKGQITLVEGARVETDQTWAITVEPLRKSSES